jgi:hypothetical protein
MLVGKTTKPPKQPDFKSSSRIRLLGILCILGGLGGLGGFLECSRIYRDGVRHH